MYRLLSFILCACMAVSLSAQENKTAHFLTAKVLFIDYESPNSEVNMDLRMTNGLEIGYLRSFGKYINFGIPLKIGVAHLAGEINNKNIVSADAIVQLVLARDKRLSPYLFGGGGIVSEEFKTSNIQFPVGAGLNFRLGRNSFLNAQAEYRKSMEDNRNNIQYGAGIVYRLNRSDRDGDGVADGIDRCPDVPGATALAGCPDKDGDGVADAEDLCPDEAGRASTQGCPDTDKDGVADSVDKCPEVRGLRKFDGCPDTDGDGIPDNMDDCPEKRGEKEMNGCPDSDGDGVADNVDRCPDQAGPATSNGCPNEDRDKDGVPDANDACPDAPGTPATRGCPDSDGDGIADKDDRCPTVPGPYAGCPDTDGDGVMDADDRCPTQAGLVNNNGCPKIDRATRETLEFAMQAVRFQTGSARLKTESYDVLNQIAEIMRRYPDHSLIISGHTDNTGDADANQKLSERRARACYDYLIRQGIAFNRMRSRGFGESSPRADNSSSEGRRLNRRTEFEMIIE